MKSFVEMHRRPYRPPRTARHPLRPDVVCMEWENPLFAEAIEVVWERAMIVYDFGFGPLTDALMSVSMERLVVPEAVTAWFLWNRVFAAHRRMFGEALDLQLGDGRWI